MALPSLSLKRNRLPEPLENLSRIQDQMDRMMASLFEPMYSAAPESYAPYCEINEDKNNYYLKFDMPGVDKSDVQIELSNQSITVSADRMDQRTGEDLRTSYSEIAYGSYSRTFNLPSEIDDSKVEAKFDRGVLLITLPKSVSNKPKQIAVH